VLSTPVANASLAAFQTAIRQVVYTHPSPGGAPPRTITVVVNDGVDDSNTATTTVTFNTPPTINPIAGVARQAGSPSANSKVAAVADIEDAEDTLRMTISNGGAFGGSAVLNGVTVTLSDLNGAAAGLNPNAGGEAFADVVAACGATSATFTLRVTDAGGLFTDTPFTVTVNPNAPPVLTYLPAYSTPNTTSVTVTPTGLSDNGSVQSVQLVSQGGYAGGISVNPGTGGVTLTGATPIGAHTIKIKAVDNCGLEKEAQFTLNVTNNPPVIAAAQAVTRQQGSAGAVSPVATVSDLDQSAGSLTVTPTSVPTGITVTNVQNTNGNVTANIAALCNAAPGPNTIIFTVNDSNGGSAAASFTVNVAPDSAPELSYDVDYVVANTAARTIAPNSLSDNGSVASVQLVSQGTYAGGISVDNSTGAVALTGAGPIGTHTITVKAVDNCGTATTRSFALVVTNNLPAIAPAEPVVRQQGTAASVSPVATVSDLDQAAGTLSVTATSVPAGITVANIQNTNGNIAATIAADCNATPGANSVEFRVADSSGGVRTASFTVHVAANSAPALAYGAAYNVANTGNVAITPTTLSDNGSIANVQLVSQGTYAGGIAVNPSTGGVTLTGAGPIGTHTITIRVTDNCGATTNASFTLNVTNNAPTIAAAQAVARQRGSSGSVSTVATASDLDQQAGTLNVAATTVPAGVTVAGITNTNGTISANIAAACDAALGPNTVVFTVADANGATATASFTVNVTANTAPVLTYANAAAPLGGSVNVTPATGPSDNGSITTIAIQSQGTYAGGIAVDPATGVVTLTNAGPVGTHTLLIRATDNCGTATDASFTVTVGKASTSIAIASDNPDPSAVGQAVTVNVAINPSTSTPAPTGTVAVTVSGGGTEACTAAVDAATSTATCTLVLTSAGARTIAATYAGDSNFTGSTDTEAHTVAQSATTTTITNAAALGGSATSVGQPYAVNFAVAPVAPGAGAPTGTVAVSDGSGATCTAALTAASNGTGSCTLTSATAGTKAITATYAGDAGFAPSAASQPATHQVVITIAGNVKQFVAFGANTNLAGVAVALTVDGSAASTATTDANGNYVFALASAASSIALAPGAPGRTFEPLSRTYSNVANNIAGADFLAYDTTGGPGANPRELRVVNTAATPGDAVAVPIEMVSLGNERAVSFSLAFDQAILGVPTNLSCGGDFAGCTVATFDTSTPGRVGVTVTRGAAPAAAGVREVVRVTFPTAANNTAASTGVTFADAPAARSIRNGDGDPLPALYRSGFVTFGQTGAFGVEGDVVDAAGTSAGGDGVRSNDVTVVRRFVLGLAAPDVPSGQFRRADVSPTETGGDGRIDATDVTVVRLYALGVLPPTPTGGPGAPTATRSDEDRTEGARSIKAATVTASAGQAVTIPVILDAQGNESSASFTLNFNPGVLTFVSASLGSGAPTGSNLGLNTQQTGQGRLGVLIDAVNQYAVGEQQMLNVMFTVAPNAPAGAYPITFSSVPTLQSVSSTSGHLLDTTYTAGGVTVGASAPSFSVTGKVLTPEGAGLRNAQVRLISSVDGSVRTATTSSFGIYSFTNVPNSGEYTLTVRSKRYRFAPRAVTATDPDLAALDLVGLQ
jgi:phosphatidate phosphatase APP1